MTLRTTLIALLLAFLATLHADDARPGKSSSAFVPPLVASQARLKRQMLHFGELHLKQMEKAIADPKADATIGANFYDRVRLLYGMADYTKDEKCAKAAAALAVAYHDKYVLPNKGNVQAWYLAPDGLAEHFKRTGDVKSKEAVLLLSQTMWAPSRVAGWSEAVQPSLFMEF